MAASTVKSYLAEAQRQHVRMRRAHRATLQELRRMRAWADDPSRAPEPPRWRRTFPYAATHFYANCWTIVGRHLMAIRDISGYPEVGRALRPHVRAFESYTALRDHYEHLDERLPGRKNQQRVGGQFYGLMAGNSFTFGNRVIDVGPNSLKTLRTAVKEVERAFKMAAIAQLERDHPARLRTLALRAQGEQIARNVQKFVAPQESARRNRRRGKAARTIVG
jgi:hypothetical protein